MQSSDIGIVRPAASSGSEGSGGRGIDDKKRRRMESNRESARRSRQRKQQHLGDVIRQIGSLKRENEEFEKRVGEFSDQFSGVNAQNKVLRSEKDRLVRRLESLESIIEIAKVVKGSVNGDEGLYEVSSDPMMKPWQLPCPTVPVVTSGIRQFNF